MIQVYCVFTVFGEPLSQTAQSFMPEMIYGANRNLAKVIILTLQIYIVSICRFYYFTLLF